MWSEPALRREIMERWSRFWSCNSYLVFSEMIHAEIQSDWEALQYQQCNVFIMITLIQSTPSSSPTPLHWAMNWDLWGYPGKTYWLELIILSYRNYRNFLISDLWNNIEQTQDLMSCKSWTSEGLYKVWRRSNQWLLVAQWEIVKIDW